MILIKKYLKVWFRACRGANVVLYYKVYAKVAKLVDALDLGSSGSHRESSSLSFRTRILLLSNT
ncbi:MAG: hypothetical protein RIT27_2218 [Pseudomonadota bacterium]